MEEITCPHCHHADRQLKVGRNRSGSQRYLCFFCQRKYTPQPKPQGYDVALRQQAIRWYVDGQRQNIRDPYRNVVDIFINCLLNGKGFYIYGDGLQKRAFSHIDDVIPAVAEAGFTDAANSEIINVGPREEYTILELSQTILDEYFGEAEVPAAMRPTHLPDRPLEVKEAFCTIDKAERLLGFRTTITLREGVRQMIKWARELGPQQPQYRVDGLEIVTDKTPTTWTEKLI